VLCCRADSSSRRCSAVAIVRRASAAASGFTDTEVIPNRTRRSANIGLVGGQYLATDWVLDTGLRHQTSHPVAELVEPHAVTNVCQPLAVQRGQFGVDTARLHRIARKFGFP
jgi:hypothetical protein